MKTSWIVTSAFLALAWTNADRVEAACPPSTDLTILDASYSTLAYIRAEGTILNASYSTLGHLRSDGSVLDSSYSTLGHLRSDGSILDSSYSTLGYVRSDGTLLNSSYSTLGHIRADGSILNSSYSTRGHVRPNGQDADAIAAYLFFFQPEMLADNGPLYEPEMPAYNTPPSQPEMLAPAHRATDVDLRVRLVWRPSYDVDGDPISYHLVLCPDAGSSHCQPIELALADDLSLHLAGTPLYPKGIAIILLVAGVVFLVLRSLRRFLFLAALGLAVLYLSSCGEVPEQVIHWHEVVRYHDVGDEANTISVEVSDLEPSTTYTWKVVAFDGQEYSRESATWIFTTRRLQADRSPL
ncbi:MAG: hypothetical protein JW797_10075 [Bradymonadales bacterium]|nr:hypothetical protein [Bradymonadales bacterium]